MQLFSTDPNHPGFFAVGQEAVGVIALGQMALGVVAIGQLARGVFCVGQGAVGVVAAGQGAIGLWYGTGMLAIAGQYGHGGALHLLPRLAREPQPALPPPTTLAALTKGPAKEGWLAARLDTGLDGEPRVLVDGDVAIDTRLVRQELLAGRQRGADRVHVFVRAGVVADDEVYRHASSHIELRAEQVVVHVSRPRGRLAYAVPPMGKVGEPTTKNAIILRTAAWLVAVAIVTVVSFVPLVSALWL